MSPLEGESSGSPSFVLRPATLVDAEFCLLVECAAMRRTLEAVHGHWDFETYRRKYTFHAGWTQIIRSKSQDVGVLVIRVQPEHWHINRFAVLPGWQGRGLGTAVLRELLRQADLSGVNVGLEVFHVNPARRLYERLGFRVLVEDRLETRMVRPPAGLLE